MLIISNQFKDWLQIKVHTPFSNSSIYVPGHFFTYIDIKLCVVVRLQWEVYYDVIASISKNFSCCKGPRGCPKSSQTYQARSYKHVYLDSSVCLPKPDVSAKGRLFKFW